MPAQSTTVLAEDGDTRLRSLATTWFGIDTRALAALRVSLGVLLLADLALRARSLTAFYTDRGVLPRATVTDLYPTISRVSLHMLSGAVWWQSVLFLVAAGFAIALALGYRTRLATMASFVLLVSLHVRNPVVLNAGDVLLRRLLLWSCFLPLGIRWSLDARRRRPPVTSRPRRIVSVASAALLLQVVTIYAINAFFKLQSPAWHSGEAVRRALAMESFTTPVGDLLTELPLVLDVANWAWLGLVVLAPLLVLTDGRRRTLLVAGFVAMHAGMALSMAIGLFPLVSIVALLAFLPTAVWDRIESRRPLDGATVPGLGHSTLDTVPRDHMETETATSRTRGVTAARVLVVVLVLVAASWNLFTLGVVPAETMTHDRIDPGVMRWDMFANPGTTDLEYRSTTVLDSGEERRDVLSSGSLGDRTVSTWTGYPSSRWRKYLVSLRYADPPGLEDELGAYLCRRTATRTDGEPVEVTVTTLEHPTEYHPDDATRRTDLETVPCVEG